MWEFDCEESWALKNGCFWTVVLEKTLGSHLDCKEIQPVHCEGDQSWVFIGRTDVEAETPILWPPNVKSWLIGKDSDAGRDWGQEEKGTTEDEMGGWHHWLDGHEFEWTSADDDRQVGLACWESWSCKESDTTELLNWTDSKFYIAGTPPAIPISQTRKTETQKGWIFSQNYLASCLSSCLADLTQPFSSVLLGLGLCSPHSVPPSGSLVGYAGGGCQGETARLKGEKAACSFPSAPPWSPLLLVSVMAATLLHPGSGKSFLWEQLNPVCSSSNSCRTSSMAPFPQRYQPSWVVLGSQRGNSRPSVCVFFHPPGG